MSELQKSFRRKSDQKNKKNKSQKAAFEQKSTSEKEEIWFKQNTRPIMNYELSGKTIQKKIQPTSILAEKFYYSKNSTYYIIQQIVGEGEETRRNGNKRTETEK